MSNSNNIKVQNENINSIRETIYKFQKSKLKKEENSKRL